MDADRLICRRMGVRRGDSLPFKGRRHVYTRRDLLNIMAELGYKKGAEIGVAEGRFSEAMLKTIPDLELLSVDLWGQHHRWSEARMQKRYEAAKKRLSPYPGCTMLKASSMEAAPTVEDGSLDFVYIDADHRFDCVMIDIILWAPKVRRGGIVAGHDYYEFYQAGVISAVRAYTQAHAINRWYITWEKEASWFWVAR